MVHMGHGLCSSKSRSLHLTFPNKDPVHVSDPLLFSYKETRVPRTAEPSLQLSKVAQVAGLLIVRELENTDC